VCPFCRVLINLNDRPRRYVVTDHLLAHPVCLTVSFDFGGRLINLFPY
jgi:hypothetical protein